MEHSPQRAVRLSVSVVLHNSSLELLQNCLHSLYVATQKACSTSCLERVVVYIIDNNSASDYRARLEKVLAVVPADDGFRISFLPELDNRGFGAGHNCVIGGLNSDFHLVLNPDVELEAESLERGLSRLLADDSIALVSPRVIGAEGELEFSCKRYPSVLVLMLRGFAPDFLRRLFNRRLSVYEMRDLCSGTEEVDVDIASGCCMLVRTAALRAEQGFDEEFFLYFEDFDLSLRLGKHGRLVFSPGMRIVHHGGYAATKGLRHILYFVQSGIHFFNCHGWRWM